MKQKTAALYILSQEMHDKEGIWDYNKKELCLHRKEKIMSRIPKPYEIYKHFKGNLYQILNIAEHSETGEKLVIYQALYGEYKVYARPVTSFMEILDKTRYPEAGQEYRFELQMSEHMQETNAVPETNAVEPTESVECDAVEEMNIDPMVLKFLDADTYEEKLQILIGLQSRISDDMITTMAVACDIEVPDGSLEERFQGLKNCLLTLDRFECNRLR